MEQLANSRWTVEGRGHENMRGEREILRNQAGKVGKDLAFLPRSVRVMWVGGPGIEGC